MSELSPGGTGGFSDRYTPEGSIGVPVPSARMRIVDPETLKDVQEGKAGESWKAQSEFLFRAQGCGSLTQRR